VLQCVAACCSVFKRDSFERQRAAEYCSVLQSVAEHLVWGAALLTFGCSVVCCRVLQGVAVYCRVLQCVAVYCRVLQCVAAYAPPFNLGCVVVCCIAT